MQKGGKIAVGGKGGVGKTTVCAVFARLFAEDGFDVLAVDADPNANLCTTFGLPAGRSPEPLIKMKQLIAERTGTSKDATSAYFRLNPKVSDLPEKYWIEVDGPKPQAENAVSARPLKLLILGGITQAGAGCACPEGAFLKAMLSHTILQRQEMVLVDLAAGPEFLGRASIKGIDVLVVVVEPGSRSIEAAATIVKMGKELGINHVAAIANKITDPAQAEVIKSQMPNITFLANIEYYPAVQQADLYCRDVFQADPELVNSLRKAKEALTSLINTDTGCNIGIK
ncbi:MAG: ATP-binding protein [Planctomycetota bacterium]